ncbi:MAG TPA: GntR family transcriptional regulator [Ruminiclostridium sp.]|nr:GntR family transcriptional regulator [Clostridiaceae bacterium]HAA25553.1 GntR family transcriptional regulator [Ruminiclostridium sp.]
MQLNFQDERPIFIQLAEQIEDAILSGAFPEETQIPSTTEISVTYKINPATALKGINILVDNGIVYKKRGVGMFVTAGAVKLLLQKRKKEFAEKYVNSLVKEAKRLNLSKGDILSMIERGFEDE